MDRKPARADDVKDPNGGKEWTFNTVADTYEKIRPGYPDELYRTLFAYCAARSSAIIPGFP